MKKYLSLIALVILTACGGGSGGGGNGTPNEIRCAGCVSAEVAASNAMITSMVSEIGVSQDGTEFVTPGRKSGESASFHFNGKNYNSIKLDDVDMQIADWTKVYKFSIDAHGRIKGIHDVDNSDIADRTPDTAEFTFTKDGQHLNWTLQSFARDIGLKYADISKLTGPGAWAVPEGSSAEEQSRVNFPVIMGYKSRKIDNHNDLGTEEIVFQGVAVGTVANHYTKPDTDNGHDYLQMPIEDKTAELTFNNGTEVLVAHFKDDPSTVANENWYDVTITKNSEGKLSFDYDDKGRTINENFRFEAAGTSTALMNNQNFSGAISGERADWVTNYYDADNGSKEATAMFRYIQPYTPTAEHLEPHIDVTMGFGGKSQQH